jgi:prephenate dehydrogenase
MKLRFPTVTLIGVGLLGGSLGLALKRREMAGEIRGFGRRMSTLEKALELGVIDSCYDDFPKAIIGSDLVVLCTPATAVPEYLDRLRMLCSSTMVVTDVASTKADICSHIREAWVEPYRFVGSHPMAGSEKFGPEHADTDLYEGAVCFVEKKQNHADDAYQAIVDLWEGVGSRIIPVDPKTHDEMVARTSHVPHIAASAVAQLIKSYEEIKPFIGNGFKDTTRIAEGRPEIWRDICLTNKESVLEGIAHVMERLQFVVDSLEASDGDKLDAFFKAGQDARDKVIEP